MLELALIGLRIQRMPSEPGLEFDIPSKYSYMTVCFTLLPVLHSNFLDENLQYYIKTKFKVRVGNISKSMLHQIINCVG